MMYRWTVFNSVLTFLVMYLVVYHNIFSWMINNDPTHISLAITITFICTSLYLGVGILWGKVEISILKHIGNSIMGGGLVGTILATFWLFQDIHGVSDTKQMILIVLNGIGTAQITTLFGLGGAWLLDQQRAFVLGVKDDDQG